MLRAVAPTCIRYELSAESNASYFRLECGECRTNKLSEQSFAPSVTWNSWTQGKSSSAPTQLGTIYPLSKTLSGRAKSVIDLKCSTDSMLHVWPPLAVGGQSLKNLPQAKL